jgi:AcrR family transcriptional regulator
MQIRESVKGAARREQILETAYRELAADGYRNISLRSIGRTLGLEPAHILYYFKSREELLQKVIERWDANALVELGSSLDGESALDYYVRAIRRNLQMPGIVHLYLTFAAEAVHPEHGAHVYFRERFQQVHELLGDAIRAEQAAGGIPASYDADLEANKLIALGDGLQLQALIDPKVDAPGTLEAVVSGLRSLPRD